MKAWVNIASLLALVSGSVFAAGDVHVKKGETWKIDATQASLTLDSLTLEDGAHIEFAPEVNLWQLSADVVRIGEGVVIDGRGVTGTDGSAGAASAVASACQNGASGGNGVAGALGEEGVTLALNLGLQQIGSLRITTLGGGGGKGGSATAGQKAGELDGCDITHGGEGGDGGRGGDGGNGGQVHLSVAVKGPNLNLDFIKQRVTIESHGGKGGKGGDGAAGGEGSPGRWLSMKTLSGDRKFVAGGQKGKNGKDGSPGQDGRPGVVDVNEDIKQHVNAMFEAGSRQMETLAADISGQKNAQLSVLSTNVLSLQDTVKALQAQVKVLQLQVATQQTAQEKTMQVIESLQKQLEQPKRKTP